MQSLLPTSPGLRGTPIRPSGTFPREAGEGISLRRLRLAELREFADRQLEGAPYLAAVAAALMRRELVQRGEDPLLHVVAPVDRQGGQHLGQDGIVGVGPFALVGLALVVEGEDARLRV